MQIAGKVEAYSLQPVFVLTEEAVRVAIQKAQQAGHLIGELGSGFIKGFIDLISQPGFWLVLGSGLLAIFAYFASAPVSVPATAVAAILFSVGILQLDEGNSNVIA